jgi:ribosomal protein S18 acetylase RimI-like enzyme
MRAMTRADLRRWPTDHHTGHLIVLDQHACPSHHDIAQWISAARDAGYRRVRTSALFPLAADNVLAAGFRSIDTLALLRADLNAPAAAVEPPGPRLRLGPLRSWHLGQVAAIDQAAFGVEWGNDVESLREIRRATPRHRGCRAVVDGHLAGFAITGAGGRTGYLQRLAVAPSHQRAGAATALVADALAWMRRSGLASALVNTGETNEAALALYARFGFRRLADRLTVAEYVLEPEPA